MLPNLKFLIGGILFCLLLFVAAGAGVMLPDSRTHFGETPEIGHPMMQRSMAEAPPQAQFYTMMVAPHGDESEPPPGGTAEQTAAMPAQPPFDPSGLLKTESLRSDPSQLESSKPDSPDPEAPKPDVIPTVQAEDGLVAYPPLGGGAPRDDPAASAQGGPAPPTGTSNNDRPGEAAAPQVAALMPPVADTGLITTPFVNVPVPPPRPIVFGMHRHGGSFHRRRSLVRQRDTFGPEAAVSQSVPATQVISAGHLPTGESVPASYVSPEGAEQR